MLTVSLLTLNKLTVTFLLKQLTVQLLLDKPTITLLINTADSLTSTSNK